jgi:hypothetical protein
LPHGNTAYIKEQLLKPFRSGRRCSGTAPEFLVASH